MRIDEGFLPLETSQDGDLFLIFYFYFSRKFAAYRGFEEKAKTLDKPY
jgi:hypothetical protein